MRVSDWGARRLVCPSRDGHEPSAFPRRLFIPSHQREMLIGRQSSEVEGCLVCALIDFFFEGEVLYFLTIPSSSLTRKRTLSGRCRVANASLRAVSGRTQRHFVPSPSHRRPIKAKRERARKRKSTLAEKNTSSLT